MRGIRIFPKICPVSPTFPWPRRWSCVGIYSRQSSKKSFLRLGAFLACSAQRPCCYWPLKRETIVVLINCPTCASKIPARGLVCPECGSSKDITEMTTLINCPGCRAKISDRAPTCPKCGCPKDITELRLLWRRRGIWWNAIRSWWKIWWSLVVYAVFAGLIALWIAFFISLTRPGR